MREMDGWMDGALREITAQNEKGTAPYLERVRLARGRLPVGEHLVCWLVGK